MKITKIKQGLILVLPILCVSIYYFYNCRTFYKNFKNLTIGMSVEEVGDIYDSKDFKILSIGGRRVLYIKSPCLMSRLLFYSEGSLIDQDSGDGRLPDPYGFIQISVGDDQKIEGFRMIGESSVYGEGLD